MGSGVYQILNTANGKRYIGSAVNIAQRWNLHRSQLRRGKHHSVVLQRAWVKYGESAFRFLPILTCAPTKQMLMFYEQQLISKVAPEYNICQVAGSSMGVKHTSVARAKMSASRLGKKRGPMSEEQRENIGKALRGRAISLEHRTKLSVAGLGNKNGVGYVPTLEQREKKIRAMTGKIHSLEWRENIAASRRGKKYPRNSNLAA